MYHQQGNITKATTYYQEVLSLQENHAGALHFLGLIAMTQKDYETALHNIEQAISCCKTKAVYWNNYGVVLKMFGRNQEAKTAYENAIKLKSNYADAWANLGQILLLLNEENLKIAYSLNNALTSVPNHSDALSHLAELRRREKQYLECAKILQKLLDLRKDDISLRRQIAECYASSNRYETAAEYFAPIAESQPINVEIQHRYAILLGESGKINEAKQKFTQASFLPNGKSLWRWKHLWYCPIYFDNTRQIDNYWQNLHNELDSAIAEQKIYDWRTLVYDGFTSSFHLPHHNRCCREIKEKFAEFFLPSFQVFHRPKFPFLKRRNGKIRVGFLVTPGHEGGFLRYMSGVVRRLNRNRFEIVLIYHQSTKNRYKNFSQDNEIQHVMFAWHFENAVQTIRESECDIIYYWKVGADVWNFFLPMTRLAPIQCTSWGTHGTSGLKQIDYSLSHNLAEIENAQEHYTEKLFLINEAPTFQPRMKIPKTYSRRELELPEKDAIYFCPHRMSKYYPDYDFYLKEILENDPKGHILLLMGDSPILAKKFQNRMKRNIGETLFRRMIFIPKQSPQRYNCLIAASTMILDSSVYSGGITAYDALSFGVPCITQTGSLLIQRYPYSYYETMKLENAPITTNRDEYVRTAVLLGTDKEYHQLISSQIHEKSDLLFKRNEVISQFEHFFETVVSESSVSLR
ncbi:MAG: hypothetical protein LBT05_07035 [Planctomycetaceae bacterium]|nr:hypothetical protein [Planctomycetaceae bacterium]